MKPYPSIGEPYDYGNPIWKRCLNWLPLGLTGWNPSKLNANSNKEIKVNKMGHFQPPAQNFRYTAKKGMS